MTSVATQAPSIVAGAPISYGRRLTLLAEAHPDRTAIVFVRMDGSERRISWAELEQRANQMARLFQDARGVDERSLVVVGLPNCPDHLVVALAAWKLGACVLPLSGSLPERERREILDLASSWRRTVAVADWPDETRALTTTELAHADSYASNPLPDTVPNPGKAIGSGGSTGRSKIIVAPRPWAMVPGAMERDPWLQVGFRAGQVQLMAGRLYHNSPFSWSHSGLFEDHTLILMERFDAALALDLVERHRVNFSFFVPTMMWRMLQVPDVRERDYSSVESFWHTAAPCPPWVKRAWIEIVGGERLFEGFGSAEAVGSTLIRGDEWLRRPGSVGRPGGSDLRILRDDGSVADIGEVGEIYLRRLNPATGQPIPPSDVYAYVGSPPARTTADGFVSVGDLGWVDEDGYLFLADRRVDLIISGGANIYPAEVEAALSEHPEVADVAVIGLPDADWGKRVHAIVQPRDPAAPPSVASLDAHCRQRLAAYKTPKSYELIVELPRDPSGKIRRSALVTERVAAGRRAVAATRRRALYERLDTAHAVEGEGRHDWIADRSS